MRALQHYNKIMLGHAPLWRALFLCAILLITQFSVLPSLGTTYANDTPTTKNVFKQHILQGPDLLLQRSGSQNYIPGQNVTYQLSVTNAPTAGAVETPEPISVTQMIPANLANITVSAERDWSIIVDAPNGPALLRATYTGLYPVAPGQHLPAITVSGVAMGKVGATFSEVANVTTRGDAQPQNDTVVTSISLQATGTPATTPTASPATDLSILRTLDDNSFNVQQSLTYNLVVSNSASTYNAPEKTTPISVVEILPAGLQNVTATAQRDWQIAIDTNSIPHVLRATYTGSYPLQAKSSLAPITVNATLNAEAYPGLTFVATVQLEGEHAGSNNLAVDTVAVTRSDLPAFQHAAPVPQLAPTQDTKGIDLALAMKIGKKNYRVGDNASYQLEVKNTSATTIPITSPITVVDMIPAGMTNIIVDAGVDWNVVFSALNGPATMSATYVGAYPIKPDTILPTIKLTGVLTMAVMPIFENTALVKTPGDRNKLNDVASNALSVTTLIPTIPPAPTLPPPTVTITPDPDLSVVERNLGGNTFVAGDMLFYKLLVSNNVLAGPVLKGNPITVVHTLSEKGMINLRANGGSNWHITLSATTSPATLTATYKGKYPVMGGTSLPPINMLGTFTTDAVPTFPHTTTVSTRGDAEPANNTASGNFQVVLPQSTKPDIGISLVNDGPRIVQPGATVRLHTMITAASGIVSAPDHVTASLILPVGLQNISIRAGQNWKITGMNKTSPMLIKAEYVGTYPVVAGQTLPEMTVTGIFANNTQVLTAAAFVHTPDDTNAFNDAAVVTLLVD